ncbi:Tfx family DNA-binding protein [Thermosphaera aggregans]|uniref:DNA binding protein, Tfx family n=1 Tax=Thermosphaera aggregans (strain DSM 11486 / M11TL) TaxID=633148 RepID=D5U0L9_THEAM|nr:Tfx family DNA-binding protein [Thermosphaera aggregans]ADG90669.1 DNA binding protein, Tfx family [Thermosphaera aggregans DSM 11486]
MTGKKYGLLTEKQYRILELRSKGYTQAQIAKILSTSRSNVSMLEKAALEKIRLAKETLKLYQELNSAAVVTVEPGTHLVDIPGIILRKADEVNVKLRANFTLIYDMLRYKAGQKGKITDRRVKILIMRDGSIDVLD